MITVLGGTGKVGSKIVENLIKEGKKVRLVARSAEKLRPFVNKSAVAMAGDILDTEFLVQAFKGSDAAFTLIPPAFKVDNYLSYAEKICESTARALELAGVSHVVNMSSVGADLARETGPVVGLHFMEERLNRIKGLNVLHIRSAFFMENLLMNMDSIKSKGLNSGPYRSEMKFPMIATKDVAAYVSERLIKKDFSGSSVRYLLGKEDISMNDVTRIIGSKINRPDLQYGMVSYRDAEKQLLSAGFSRDVSRIYIEMSKAFNEGIILHEKRSSENTTVTSFEQFCIEVIVPIYREALPKAA